VHPPPQEQKPWVVIKEDQCHCGALVTASVGVVVLLAALAQPIMPSLAERVLQQLALPPEALSLDDDALQRAFRPETIVPAGVHFRH
jgi:methionyl-tRNA synthetase